MTIRELLKKNVATPVLALSALAASGCGDPTVAVGAHESPRLPDRPIKYETFIVDEQTPIASWKDHTRKELYIGVITENAGKRDILYETTDAPLEGVEIKIYEFNPRTGQVEKYSKHRTLLGFHRANGSGAYADKNGVIKPDQDMTEHFLEIAEYLMKKEKVAPGRDYAGAQCAPQGKRHWR